MALRMELVGVFIQAKKLASPMLNRIAVFGALFCTSFERLTPGAQRAWQLGIAWSWQEAEQWDGQLQVFLADLQRKHEKNAVSAIEAHLNADSRCLLCGMSDHWVTSCPQARHGMAS